MLTVNPYFEWNGERKSGTLQPIKRAAFALQSPEIEGTASLILKCSVSIKCSTSTAWTDHWRLAGAIPVFARALSVVAGIAYLIWVSRR